MILVAGGTGRLGTKVVKLLRQRGLEVRVLTRDRTRAAHLVDMGVDVVEGDVGDPTAVQLAVEGARGVISAIHGFAGTKNASPATVDRDGNSNLIQAGRKAGVDHLVLVSVQDASRNPINWVSASDVARFVETAIVDPALRGQTIEVGGPENLSVTEFLDVFRSETASNGKVGHVPLAGMRVGAIVMKLMDPSMARTIQGAIVMDTRPQSFNATETRRSFLSIPVTTLAEVVRRDFADSICVARAARSGP